MMSGPDQITTTNTAYPYRGDINVRQVNMTESKALYAPVEYRQSYINKTHVPIVIVWRSGLKTTIPAENALNDNSAFTIEVEMSFGVDVKKDVQRVLSAVDEKGTVELRKIKEAFANNVEGRWGRTRVLLDYSITIPEIKKLGGSIYYEELDIVISLNGLDDAPPHPYSEEGKSMQLINVGDIKDIGFSYNIDVIDNLGIFGTRYININNKVYKVTPKKDMQKRDGIYVASNAPVDNAIEINAKSSEYHAFDKAAELGLFRSIDEAMALGDMESARKKELLNLEHSLQVSKREYQELQNRFDIEVAEKDRLLKEAEHQLKEADIQLQKTKDHYENKSFQRKDSSETLKFVPGVIAAIGSMFLAIKAFL